MDPRQAGGVGRNKDKDLGGGKSSGAGTQALSSFDPREAGSVGRNTPAQQAADRDAALRNSRGSGGLSSTPNATDTTDLTGRPQYQGTSPYIADPSAGQILGALASAVPGLGTLNALGGAAARALSGEDPTTDDGGLLGSGVDKFRGVKPGEVTGYTGNRIASSTNSRGERPSDDSRLADRAGAAATAALTGDAPDTGSSGAAFSDILLSDRRKPRSDLAGSNLLLRAMA